MYHIRKFKDNSTYRAYLENDDDCRPFVAYILNRHVEDMSDDSMVDKNVAADDWSTTGETTENTPGVPKHSLLPKGADNKRWIDYHNFGEHWIEIFNGNLYFNTMNTSLGLFDASVNSSGNLNITVPTGSTTRNSSAWYSYDENGVLNFWNYPEDYLDD